MGEITVIVLVFIQISDKTNFHPPACGIPPLGGALRKNRYSHPASPFLRKGDILFLIPLRIEGGCRRQGDVSINFKIAFQSGKLFEITK
jgi:hypothetical protein